MLQIAELVPKHHGRTKKQETAASSSVAGPKSGKHGKKKK
jgi:signal recognition particle subunit SRP19